MGTGRPKSLWKLCARSLALPSWGGFIYQQLTRKHKHLTFKEAFAPHRDGVSPGDGSDVTPRLVEEPFLPPQWRDREEAEPQRPRSRPPTVAKSMMACLMAVGAMNVTGAVRKCPELRENFPSRDCGLWNI